MISAKEVNERAAVVRKKIADQEAKTQVILRAEMDADIAPIIVELLSEIEQTIMTAMDKGAYAIYYPVKPLKNATSDVMKAAYVGGLLIPLRAAGFDVGFRGFDGHPYELAIRWEGA